MIELFLVVFGLADVTFVFSLLVAAVLRTDSVNFPVALVEFLLTVLGPVDFGLPVCVTPVGPVVPVACPVPE